MPVKVNGLAWTGVRAEDFDAQVRFFGETLGLRKAHEEPGFVAFRTPEGQLVEVFAPDYEPDSPIAATPSVGFSVDDIEAARAALEADGIEFIGEIEGDDRVGRWTHFRGPDGNVYELTWRP